MKKRVSASKIMRVVSILGIIMLLTLQWVWWRNAYRAVEMDMMVKAEECLKKATDVAMMNHLDSTSAGIPFINVRGGEKMVKLEKNDIVFPKHKAKTASELSYSIEEAAILLNRPITEQIIDKQYCKSLNERFGFLPKHSIKIFRLKKLIEDDTKPYYNRISIGNKQDTIYYQIGYMAYTVVVIPSPIGFYLKKGSLILLISIILVLLIGAILIFQYLNMQRERKFTDFIIDYTRMMTHDLRTPVSGVQMIFKMFQKDDLSPEKKKLFLNEGVNMSKKILLNVDNILYVAKSEQRELPVHLLDENIPKFMDRILRVYKEREYNPKKVTIVTKFEPANFKCRIDIQLMENVFCNLVDNAIKYTGNDALIEITCTKVNENVVFMVRDNGMGMSESNQKQIFELFERGSADRIKQFPGFGIGLHFVERAVKAHGGKITVQSEEGKGTTFTINYTSLAYS